MKNAKFFLGVALMFTLAFGYMIFSAVSAAIGLIPAFITLGFLIAATICNSISLYLFRIHEVGELTKLLKTIKKPDDDRD